TCLTVSCASFIPYEATEAVGSGDVTEEVPQASRPRRPHGSRATRTFDRWLLHFGSHDHPQADRHRQRHPEEASDTELGPLFTSHRAVEQCGLRVVEVDPRLEALEPVLARRQQHRQGWEHE